MVGSSVMYDGFRRFRKWVGPILRLEKTLRCGSFGWAKQTLDDVGERSLALA
jgi:hypothetical protein